jgi:hypothetical protein
LVARWVVTNQGPDEATSVTVNARVPADWLVESVQIEPSTATVLQVSQGVDGAWDRLAAGESTTLTLTVRSGGPGTFALTGSTSAFEADFDLANNTASAAVTVTPLVDLTLTGTVIPGSVSAGQSAAVLWDLGNLGPDPATTVTMTGAVPLHLSVQAVATSVPGALTFLNGQTFRVELPGLPPAGQGSVQLTLGTAAVGAFSIAAHVASIEQDSVPGNNEAVIALTVVPAPFETSYLRRDNLALATLTPPGASTGWFPIGANDPTIGFPTIDSARGLLLTVIPQPGSPRITGAMTGDSERLPFRSIGSDSVVRGKFSLRAEGQSDGADSTLIPNLRIRLSQRFAATSMITIFHHLPGTPGDLAATREYRPTTSPALLSTYRVDFLPYLTPLVASQLDGEGVARAVEAYANSGREDGRILVAESSIGVYPREALATSRTLGRFVPNTSGFGSMDLAQETDLYAVTWFPEIQPDFTLLEDPAAPKPLHTVSASGVTLDTRNIPVDRIGVVVREFGYSADVPAYAQRPRMEPGRQPVVRFRLDSPQAAGRQPYIRMRARMARFGWSHSLEIGGAQNAGAANRALAQEILPGLGSANPERDPLAPNGGWYTLVLTTPFQRDIRPEFPESADIAVRMPNLGSEPGPGVDAPSLRDIRVALDMADSISFTAEAGQEEGLVTVDRIEITDVAEVTDR